MERGERKIVVELASSADGYIARPDGDVEWLNRRPHEIDYGMEAFQASIDTILLGRKTYDWAVAYLAKTGTKSFFDNTYYIFTSKPPEKSLSGEQFVNEPVKEFAERLRTNPGKNIWMMGGGQLIASFLDVGEIDEFQIKVIPTLIGEGIPLIAPRHRDIELKLLETKGFADGVVSLHYEVVK
jgi:dihydrofolate reductase